MNDKTNILDELQARIDAKQHPLMLDVWVNSLSDDERQIIKDHIGGKLEKVVEVWERVTQNAIAHGAINTGECITGHEDENGLWHIRAAYDRDEGPQLGTAARIIGDGESFHFGRYENTDAVIHSTFRVMVVDKDDMPEYISIRSKITAKWDRFVAWVNAGLGYK